VKRISIFSLIIILGLGTLLSSCSSDENPVDPPAPKNGGIAISATPLSLDRGWEIVGPDDYIRSGAGDSTIIDVPIGQYELNWTSYQGWDSPTPNPNAFEVVADQSVEISGEYIALIPYPSTRDILMNNFKQIYEDRDYDKFRDMMHEDFFMVLQQSTQENFPDVGEFIELDEELYMHGRMFAGDPVIDPSGSIVPGIAGISFYDFRQIDQWVTSAPNDTFYPNSDYGTWQVDILFSRPGFKDYNVKGRIQFYVVSRDSLHEGTVQPYWQMFGQIDLTNQNHKATEAETWGGVKALFR